MAAGAGLVLMMLAACPLALSSRQLGRVLKPARVLAPPRRVLASGPGAAALGQDLGELFELYAPPDGPTDVRLQPGVAPRPLGQRKPRGEVHRDGDWHRSVHIWLVSAEPAAPPALLMQRRSAHKDTFPNRWDVSAAGHVTAGDTSLETATKELHEELGLDMPADALERALWVTLPACARGETQGHGEFVCNEFQDLYVLRAPEAVARAPDALALGADEVSDVRLFPLETVLRAWEQGDPDFVPRAQHYRSEIGRAVDVLLRAA